MDADRDSDAATRVPFRSRPFLGGRHTHSGCCTGRGQAEHADSLLGSEGCCWEPDRSQDVDLSHWSSSNHQGDNAGNNSTAVSRTSNITATFSEAVTGVSASTVTLRLGATATGTQVASAVSYNATTRTVTLNPGVTLAANTKYTARIIGTGTGPVRDIAGNPVATKLITFTTGPEGPVSPGTS
jgi:hypothetical protein